MQDKGDGAVKVSMQLTFDGLVQALRWKAHALAEDLKAGTVARQSKAAMPTIGLVGRGDGTLGRARPWPRRRLSLQKAIFAMS